MRCSCFFKWRHDLCCSLNDAIMLCNSLAIWVLDPQALDIRELHILRKETRSLQTVLIEAGIKREEWLSFA